MAGYLAFMLFLFFYPFMHVGLLSFAIFSAINEFALPKRLKTWIVIVAAIAVGLILILPCILIGTVGFSCRAIEFFTDSFVHVFGGRLFRRAPIFFRILLPLVLAGISVLIYYFARNKGK